MTEPEITEEEWLAGAEAQWLLECLRSRTTARKSRLLAVSFCRQILPLIEEVECAQRAVASAEQFADGRTTLAEMLALSEQVFTALVNFPHPASVNADPPLAFKAKSIAIQATGFLTQDSDTYLIDCCICTYKANDRWTSLRAGAHYPVAPYRDLCQWQVALIQEVLGNPFRPVTIEPAWLTATVVSLATAIYDDRAFDRLPILGDALEDAGCTNADLLHHLRQGGAHVRGCWALDCLLEKDRADLRCAPAFR